MRKETAIDVAVGALALGLLAAGLGPETHAWFGSLFDDAYIYLRYAQNLSECPLEWNCGFGPVEGFTSPAYLALLGFVHYLLSVDLEVAAGVLGVVTWGVALVGFTLLPFRTFSAKSPFRRLAPIGIALAFFDDQIVAQNIASGMEGGLVAAASLGLVALAYHPQRLKWLVPWTVLVRPELGLFTLLQPVLSRDRLKQTFGYAAGVFFVITVARFALFHDVLPNTFWAKSGGTIDHLQSGGRYLLESVTRFPLAALAVAAVPLAQGPLRYAAVVYSTWLLYFLWSGGDFYTSSRIYAFLTPMAVFTVFGLLAERLSQRGRRTAVAATACCLVLAASGHLVRDRYESAGGYGNVQRWSATGKYLSRCLPGQSVAAVPIGALAYFSGANVFDLVGLTDARMAIAGDRITGDDFLVGHERSDPEWILALQPDIIMFDVWSEEPPKPTDRPVLHMFVELELARTLQASRAPYERYYIPTGSEFQMLLIRTSARWTEDLQNNQCL